MIARRRGEVFIGDLVRAIRALDVSPADAPAIAAALGLAPGTAARGEDEAGSAAQPTSEIVPPTDLRRGPADQPAPRRRPRPAVAEPAQVRRSALRRIPATGGPPPLWLNAADPVERAQPEHRRRADPEPLLLPRWTPAVLTTLLATNAPSTDIDAIALVDEIARCQPLDRVRMLPRPTLARGAQVLVDLGDGMLPFAHDQTGVVRSLRVLLGGSPVDVLRFAGCPSRDAGRGRRSTWGPYRPPETPRPVVVLTDLDAGDAPHGADRALPGEWIEFADTLAHAGCPLVALVPYPAARVPGSLRERVRVVPWERATSVGVVRRALGGTLGVA